MRMIINRDDKTDETVYTIRISRRDLAEAKLRGFDYLVLREIEQDPQATISDTLLGLELISRRVEEVRVITTTPEIEIMRSVL